MKKYIIFMLFTLFAGCVTAKSIQVTVKDKVGIPIEFATISLLNKQDSAFWQVAFLTAKVNYK